MIYLSFKIVSVAVGKGAGCLCSSLPEGMVKLNESAGEILSRVDGTKSISCITEELEKKFRYLIF